jgi:toxin YoeB
MPERDKFEKIVQLIEEIRRTPFTGTGKPEPLKKPLDGLWSRRINKEHRSSIGWREKTNSSIC